MNLLAHVLTALTLGEILGLNLFAVILGSILPDLDYMFGITHRTLMHSLLFLTIISLISYKRNKKFGISLFIGISSHLLLDVLTTQGVMLLWPLNTFYSYSLFNSLDTTANLILIILAFVILWNKDIIKDKLLNIDYKKIQKIIFSILIIPLFLVIPYYYFQLQNCTPTTINNILNNVESFDEKCVIVNANICSSVETYTSNNENTYLIFDICQEDEQVVVWLLNSITNEEFNENDNITLTGEFTTKFLQTSGYEIYMIKSIRKN